MAAGELAVWLQRPVRTDVERTAIRVAEGWLVGTTSLAAWPDPAPEDLRAWALELAGIAADNPRGLATRTVEDDTAGWVVTRRAEILAAAARRYGGGPAPTHCFPPAPAPTPI